MNRTNSQRMSTLTLVTGAILTALVVLLQYMGAVIRFGPFSVSLVLIPIVIGTATCGKWIGTWLGFMFGVSVLISGDAAAFLAVNPIGTFITVLAKGALCGLIAGLAYEGAMKLFKDKTYPSALISAIICPIVNTGVFLIGCFLFFMPTIREWAGGENVNVAKYIIFYLVGGNFLFELLLNVVLSPVIVRILKAIRRK